jgi:glycosyltransferase involved in cell wall biosynthesis
VSDDDERRLRLLAYTDSQQVGGAELALSYLLGALAPEIEVGVLSTSRAIGETIAARRPGSAVLDARAPQGSHDRRALVQHVRVVRAFGPDILHANQAWPWACAYGELAALLTPDVRVVATEHLPVAGAIPRVRRLARRGLARRLDAHVAVGERAAREIEEIVGLARGSVGSVPNGVPVVELEPLSRVAAGPIVGSLGRLTRQKGYDLLVRALPGLVNATLVLVGDGPERDALQTLAHSLGVADRVIVTGWTAEARRYLPSFDVFALPSRWEGMPLGIIEAMHAGLAVVASDVGSVAEAVIDGETGFLVPADDLSSLRERLARLLVDPTLRGQMGDRARALAGERFTDVAMARAYERLYRRVLNARAPARSHARG